MALVEHQARKRFGQNFLVDQRIINHIVRSIRPQAIDNLVEIGPGKGAITTLLLNACPNLNVVELDRDLIPILKATFSDHPNLVVHQADALKFDFATLASLEKPLRIVGNLPYNISTPLIFHLLSFRQLVQDMHFMLQKEVVLRMAAQVGDNNYGRLGIMTQYFCQVEHLFDVGPECFRPVPKVESAIVRLTPYTELPFKAESHEALEIVVRTAFSQRRKTLRNALKVLFTDEQLETAGLNPSLRPENVSLAQYVQLANVYAQSNSSTRANVAEHTN
ncbi:MAG TPA: 16S rRNA (adenine(1518)-N(6)/adenine(1519)-N(6))-dimethyltransferase RsmA [Cellvibrionaceae bacterium]